MLQVSHLLKDDGRFVSITWAQPHFRKKLLAKSEYHWSIQTRTFGSGFDFFIYIMTKGQQLSENDVILGQNRPRLAQVSKALLEEDSEDFLNNISADQ